MRKSFLVLWLLVCGILSQPSRASAEITLDGTLGPQKNLTGPHYEVEVVDGKLIGNTNLFHSFGAFSIATGESVTFNGPDSVARIIGRVTGGAISSIDGQIRSAIPSADLFLLNPSGFMFGPNASLDINGSFHVSTADYIRFEEQGVFTADTTQNTTLVVAPVSAFGFLGGNPSPIDIQGSTLELPAGETFSMVSGDINIVDQHGSSSDLISAPGGQINLLSVASAGELAFNPSLPGSAVELKDFNALGEINLIDAYVDAGGNGGGTVFIRSGKLVLDDSALYASAKGPVVNDMVGKGLDIEVTGDVSLNDSAIGTNVFHGVTSDSGGVRISAENISFYNSSWIQSVAFSEWNGNPASIGNSGDISITSKSLMLDGFSGITARTGGVGDGGIINVTTKNLTVKNGSVITGGAFAGSGDSGNINVNAENILFSNLLYPDNVTGFFVQTYWPGTGKAGDITINSKNLTLLPGTEISAGTFYIGQAGNIQLNITGNMRVMGTKQLNSNGGTIYTGVFSNTFWTADGGTCTINASNLTLSNNSAIQASTVYSGNAGAISISTENLEITDGAFISADGYHGTGGNAGKIDISSDDILISGLDSYFDSTETYPTGITTVSSPLGGIGGNIHIATDSIKLFNKGIVSAVSWGPDPSGNIAIAAQNIDIQNNASINNSTYAEGDGGVISLAADRLLLSHGGHIASISDGSGSGGDIAVSSNETRLLENAFISTQSNNAGDAGNISLLARDFFSMKDSRISTAALKADGGNIKIDNRDMVKLINSEITASVGGGDQTTGGNISIDPQFVILNNSQIVANAFAGTGGNIDIVTDTFLADPQSVVDASSTLGVSGTVDIQAPVSNVTGILKPLSAEFVSAAALLKERCMARVRGNQYSSLIVGGRDGMPLEPGNLLPGVF